MIKYAKLTDGQLVFAPKVINEGKGFISNPHSDTLLAHGYKPVIETEEPQQEGYRAVSHWEETEEAVVLVWELEEVEEAEMGGDRIPAEGTEHEGEEEEEEENDPTVAAGGEGTDADSEAGEEDAGGGDCNPVGDLENAECGMGGDRIPLEGTEQEEDADTEGGGE